MRLPRTSILFAAIALATGCGGASPDWGARLERSEVTCRGVPTDVHPLEHAEVLAARRIGGFEGRPRRFRTRGARLLVRPRPDTSPDQLERWSQCLAERWSLHHLEERPSHDPLAVEGVEIDVRSGPSGHEIWMTANEQRAGQEIYRRALEAVD